MEQKYEFARRAGVPEESLSNLKQRMDVMKEKVGEKKAELKPEEIAELNWGDKKEN